jgi:hypothetical protein
VAIAWADVLAIAPELTTANVPVATQTVLLAVAERQIDDEAWGDFADDGRRYLTAHLGALYMGGSAGGAVQSESVGPMSRSYMMPVGIRGALSTTKYGVFYLHLISLLPCSLGFVP